MKILHVIIGLDIGGAELMLRRLIASHIGDPEFRHVVVSLGDDGPVGQQLREMGIEVETLGLKSTYQLLGVFVRLVKLIHRHRPDIVQTWMYHADLIGGVAARIAGRHKVIWGIRNTDLFSRDGVSQTTGWIMRVCAVLSRVVPHTIICAAHRARKVHAEAGYALKKMTVISNGFDVNRFKPLLEVRCQVRGSLSLPSEALIIGSVGRFNEYKDHRSFIMAAAKLASTDSRVYFLMVGRDVDSNNATIQRWIKESGYRDRFRLMGFRSDVPSMFASMDIFCLHSKSEGFPNVLGEAMCAGLPSVVTDVGDAALLVGDAGFVVLPQDVDALARGLFNLVQMSSESRNLLGIVARGRIEQHYSMSQVKNQYEDLYKKVMSE